MKESRRLKVIERVAAVVQMHGPARSFLNDSSLVRLSEVRVAIIDLRRERP
jgi:hypothetical protein